jgi:hypothetical protein
MTIEDDGFDNTASQYHSTSGAPRHAEYYTLRDKKQESGFEDIEGFPVKPFTCGDFSHAPPTHLHIPAGKRYRHVCPGCGMTTYVYSAEMVC